MVVNKAFHNAASQFDANHAIICEKQQTLDCFNDNPAETNKENFVCTYSRREVITFSDFVSSRGSSKKLLCELFERSSSLCNNSNNNNSDAIHEHEPCQPELKALEPFTAQREAESI